MPPWPWMIGLGIPVVPDEYSTYSGWSAATCSNSTGPGSIDQLAPRNRRRARGRRRGRATPRWRAGWAARHGWPAPRRGDRCRDCRTGSRRPPAAPWDRSAPKRSSTACTPNSGAQLVQIAPRLAVARKATIVSGTLGRYAATRSPAPTPSRCRPIRARPTCSESSSQVSERRWSRLRMGDDRRSVAVVAKDVFGVVQAGVDEPLGAGHRRRIEDLRVRPGRMHVEELPDGAPEAGQVVDRPSPQGRRTSRMARCRGNPARR